MELLLRNYYYDDHDDVSIEKCLSFFFLFIIGFTSSWNMGWIMDKLHLGDLKFFLLKKSTFQRLIVKESSNFFGVRTNKKKG